MSFVLEPVEKSAVSGGNFVPDLQAAGERLRALCSRLVSKDRDENACAEEWVLILDEFQITNVRADALAQFLQDLYEGVC